MKYLKCLILLLFISCNNHQNNENDLEINDTSIISDTIDINNSETENKILRKEFSNERFRQVLIDKQSLNEYRIYGEAQIFEANFNWVVKNENTEIDKGYEMTEIGAPEWGKFDFTIDIPKEYFNSKLNITLYEISAKDGTSQNELTIPLN